ncbi:MAG: flavodoxin family protein, partial [Pseudomonadota bacterium]
MKVLGIYGSPRKKGNTDQLLDRALEGAEAEGAEVTRVYARDLKMSGCIECGGCDKTGQCVVKDDMQTVYPLM